MKFNQLGLNQVILKAVQTNGYQTPSAIQEKTIPLILKGFDVMGQAQTGTGKTAAFALPILQKLDPDQSGIQALIVSPTRELAMQTQRAVAHLGDTCHAKVQAIYGGSDVRRQIRGLRQHPQIIVGTPGRIIDLIGRGALRLDQLSTLVLDEADDMLNMGFLPDIKKIVGHLSASHQTLLFSATMPPSIEKVGRQFMNHPRKIEIESKGLTTDLIDQYCVRTRAAEKFNVLTRFFDVDPPKVTIVFCKTKRRVNEVARGLVKCGFQAEGLQGDLSQGQRSKVMNDFKFGRINILVATDVAARGIDVNGVTQVYNFDLPQDQDSYVHRIGRTGRAGHHGVSITMFEPRERRDLRGIERLTKVRMTSLRPPSQQQALAGQLKIAEAKIDRLVKRKNLTKFSREADQLLKQYNPRALVSVLLMQMTKSRQDVRITSDRPFHKRRRRHFGHRHFRGRRRSHRRPFKIRHRR